MTQKAQPKPELTDDALYALLRRAMRNTLILGTIPALVLAIASGWRDAVMLLTGMVISAASIWEWKRLATLISARMDNRRTPAGAPVVVLLFLFRLCIFAAMIYVSLKFIHGSAVALLCGLGLAVFTMGWEALRMLRE
jgi:hypothetical protein